MSNNRDVNRGNTMYVHGGASRYWQEEKLETGIGISAATD